MLAKMIPKLLLGVVLILAACTRPLPPEKWAYAGYWQGTDMTLSVTRDGAVDYTRVNGAKTVSINAPLKEFLNDDFVVGIGFLTTTFKVSEPPKMENNQWTMVVDGVLLTKLDD